MAENASAQDATQRDKRMHAVVRDKRMHTGTLHRGTRAVCGAPGGSFPDDTNISLQGANEL